MTHTDFINELHLLPMLDETEHLIKEIATHHIGQRGVLVRTTQLDLDTDGIRDPSITKWDKSHQDDTSLHWLSFTWQKCHLVKWPF